MCWKVQKQTDDAGSTQIIPHERPEFLQELTFVRKPMLHLGFSVCEQSVIVANLFYLILAFSFRGLEIVGTPWPIIVVELSVTALISFLAYNLVVVSILAASPFGVAHKNVEGGGLGSNSTATSWYLKQRCITFANLHVDMVLVGEIALASK